MRYQRITIPARPLRHPQKVAVASQRNPASLIQIEVVLVTPSPAVSRETMAMQEVIRSNLQHRQIQRYKKVKAKFPRGLYNGRPIFSRHVMMYQSTRQCIMVMRPLHN